MIVPRTNSETLHAPCKWTFICIEFVPVLSTNTLFGLICTRTANLISFYTLSEIMNSRLFSCSRVKNLLRCLQLPTKQMHAPGSVKYRYNILMSRHAYLDCPNSDAPAPSRILFFSTLAPSRIENRLADKGTPILPIAKTHHIFNAPTLHMPVSQESHRGMADPAAAFATSD